MTAKFRRHNWVWTRIENVDRDRTLLPVKAAPVPPCLLCGIVGFGASLLDDAGPDGAGGIGQFKHVVLGPEGQPVFVEEEPAGRIQAYTFGYERDLPLRLSWLNAGLGVQFTAYGLPPQFQATYGNRPSTTTVFLRFRPAGNMSDHMKQMHRQ